MLSIVKWQALISRHLIAAYLRAQSLLRYKNQLKRCIPNGIILWLSGLSKNFSFRTPTYLSYLRILCTLLQII